MILATAKGHLSRLRPWLSRCRDSLTAWAEQALDTDIPASAVIRQAEAAECGLACLAMVARAHGAKVDLNGLRARFGVSLRGASLRSLMRMANEFGFGTRAVRLHDLQHLERLKLPAVLHWDLSHFVVLTQVKRRLTVLDPALGVRRMDLEEFSKHFTGVALELTPSAGFDPPDLRRRTGLSDLWSRITGWKRAALQLLVLSSVLQLAVLAFPFYLQLAIDEAVASFDLDVLLLLALGFGALQLINGVTEAARSWVILTLGQSLTFQMVGNLFRHLLRLPVDFFGKRHVGDIISRMASTEPIQKALTQSVVAALLDGALLVVTAIVIFVYSWRLSLVVLVAVALHVAISLLAFPLLRTREEEEIVARASEQTHLIESIRASTVIKLFGHETEREAAWRNKFADVINAGVRVGKVEILVAFSQNVLFGLQTILVVYLGARMVIEQQGFSVGMLFAFMSYRQQFADRVVGLVQRGIEFRMLGLHLERLSDIVQAEREHGLDQGGAVRTTLLGAVELERVSFRYAPGEPFVFEDLSLKVKPGEFVAVVGPSGGGKTTLLKVMLGLLAPTSGELRVDGRQLHQIGLEAWRTQTGVVSQDDQLLSGTIADNIAFFDPELDMDRVAACASAARVHEDIMRMPMNYLSLVGDMGTALSGGQRQRIILARALYREPKVLFLDEGTANLDEATEREIGDLIAALPITRIVVAHRPELVRRADRVVEMVGGQLHERCLCPASSKAPERDFSG